MKLIGGGGATTTSWALIKNNGEVMRCETQGLSPMFLSGDEIEKVLRQEVFPEENLSENESEIFFCGAGCGPAERQKEAYEIFEKVFPHATLSIDNDLLGAIRALCKNEKGIGCILGTGSASGLFDGEKIIDQVASLGFYLGDEGSGAHLGRLLIQAYFYRDMPDSVAQEFEKAFSVHEIVRETYASPTPSRYVGSFSKFCYEHRNDACMQQLIKKSFDQFIDAHIAKYRDADSLPVHACGSTAFYFQEEWKKTLEERGFIFGIVLQNPIDGLVEYHRK